MTRLRVEDSKNKKKTNKLGFNEHFFLYSHAPEVSLKLDSFIIVFL